MQLDKLPKFVMDLNLRYNSLIGNYTKENYIKKIILPYKLK